MIPLLRCSVRLYQALLLFYPSRLRQTFGAEMAAVFADDLADAWRIHGVPGVITAWWRALAELPRNAWPAVPTPELLGPAVSLALHLLFIAAFLALAMLPGEGLPHAIAHGFVDLHPGQ